MTSAGDKTTVPSRRVFMLQLDAINLAFVQEHFDDLPNLKQLFKTGQLLQTKSTADEIKASAWASFASASDPGTHGQYFPLQWDPETMSMHRAIDPYWGDRLDFEPFWYDFGRAGYRCIAFDPNEVIPHDNAPVLEILNWSSQENGWTTSSDPEILKELHSRFGRRPIGKEIPVKKSLDWSRKLRDQAINSVEKKCDAILWLSQKQPWDLFIACIYDLHRAGHNLWDADASHASPAPEDALLDVFKAFDRKLAEILRVIETEETAIIVYSLHGMDENKAQNHLLPEILKRLNNTYLETELDMELARPKAGIMSFLRETVPPRLQYVVANMLSERVQDWVVGRQYHGALNWDQTAAFALPSGDEGYIRLNLEGREKSGFLPDSGNTKTHFIEWLREKLLDIKVVQSGEPLIERFDLIEDLFPGPRSQMLPDIILQWKPGMPVAEVSSEAIGIVQASLQTGRNGNHSGESFAVLAGDMPNDTCSNQLQNITDYKSFVHRLLSA